ncbi:MAG: hypothetical protein AB2A00_42765 [Myxococcota bacterium]
MSLRGWAKDRVVGLLRNVAPQDKAEVLGSLGETLIRAIPPAEMVEISRTVLPRLLHAMIGGLAEKDKAALANVLIDKDTLLSAIKDSVPSAIRSVVDAMNGESRLAMLKSVMTPDAVSEQLKELIPSVVANIAEHDKVSVLKGLMDRELLHAVVKERLPGVIQSLLDELTGSDKTALLKSLLTPDLLRTNIKDLLAGLSEQDKVSLLTGMVDREKMTALVKEQLAHVVSASAGEMTVPQKAAMLKSALAPEAVSSFLKSLAPTVGSAGKPSPEREGESGSNQAGSPGSDPVGAKR